MSTDRYLGPEALAEKARVNALRPKESDFIGKRGYERKYRDPNNEAAGYDWRYRYKPNDGHGKTTREFNEVAEMLKPFQRADVERVQNQPASPALTDHTVRPRGRSRARRAEGSRVERGVGRWCATTPYPWTPVPEGGNADGSWK